ncbi:electron transport complex subunit RsxC [Cecembia calidifontis]|jgi:electron transport complex protein RnfC|uniref:Ion-translocating oxidoreductase complex subunit C n=1 Tax=Cecembia calidifontis TaxID=1187080 RepID=A0A4Q7P8S5_9BACT|nr:electron transport complex subunit RsxC [Cecembia calidifontis]RZS96515.1 electron transport complex protein RnfC [Cecembia calidifontis]
MFLLAKNTFSHGIHPPENKEETNRLPIRQFPFAPLIILPMQQHIGTPSQIIVKEGQEVARGQLLAKANGYMSVPLHSPVSGKIRKIANVPVISGQMVPGLYLEPFPFSGQEISEGKPIPLSASPEEILQGIQDAGIVGLGGAAFPTHVKLKIPEGKKCDHLLINGIECEPYLTTDHRVMLEQADDIFMGIRYLLKATGAKEVIIGIEANKLDAAEHLSGKIPKDLPVSVQVVPVKYPQGAEKMLITSILGKEVPSGGLPIDVNTVVVNVATTAEIGRLLPHGQGIQERVITITGPAISKKGNYLIPIGTPLRYILEQVGASKDICEVFMGGPMMGVSASSLDISIVKGTSGIVVFGENDTKKTEKIYPCIKCGACVDACPLFLNPSKLGILAKSEAYETMVEEYNLMDCFECGSCTYVCPSNIPLVQYFRLSKGIIRKRKANSQKSNV